MSTFSLSVCLLTSHTSACEMSTPSSTNSWSPKDVSTAAPCTICAGVVGLLSIDGFRLHPLKGKKN